MNDTTESLRAALTDGNDLIEAVREDDVYCLTREEARRLLLVKHDALAVALARLEAAERELEQWHAEKQDAEHPKIRPMTRIENRCMDLEGEVGYLQRALYLAIKEGGTPEGWAIDMDDGHGLASAVGGGHNVALARSPEEVR